MKIKLLFVSLLLLCVATSYSQTTSSGLNRFIDNIREELEIPEISAAVVETDKVFYGTSGIPKTVKSDTAILKSKMHLGSISKTITSFVAMKMVEDNMISLDDKLGNIVPELSGIGESNSTTLADLLSGKANINLYNRQKDFKKVPEFQGSLSDKMLSFAKVAMSKKSSGGKLSNAGYIMAALMLERASKLPYEELIRKVIEDDLKLSCFTSMPDKTGLQNFWGSWGDSNLQIAHFASKPALNNDYMMPAEGISMDIVDFSKILQMHLNGLLGDSNYLDYSSFSKIHFEEEGLGYGWNNTTFGEGYKMSFHDNQSDTYFSHTVVIPRLKIAVVIMARVNDISGAYGVYELRDRLIENYRK